MQEVPQHASHLAEKTRALLLSDPWVTPPAVARLGVGQPRRGGAFRGSNIKNGPFSSLRRAAPRSTRTGMRSKKYVVCHSKAAQTCLASAPTRSPPAPSRRACRGRPSGYTTDRRSSARGQNTTSCATCLTISLRPGPKWASSPPSSVAAR